MFHILKNFDILAVVLPRVIFVDLDGGIHDSKSDGHQFVNVQYCDKREPQRLICLS